MHRAIGSQPISFELIGFFDIKPKNAMTTQRTEMTDAVASRRHRNCHGIHHDSRWATWLPMSINPTEGVLDRRQIARQLPCPYLQVQIELVAGLELHLRATAGFEERRGERL
ncbi:hypothetical protein [Streptomyces murinus]